MSNFILDDKDFESIKADVPKSSCWLEIRKIDDKFYSIFDHVGDIVAECGTFTKQELRTIWQMLSRK